MEEGALVDHLRSRLASLREEEDFTEVVAGLAAGMTRARVHATYRFNHATEETRRQLEVALKEHEEFFEELLADLADAVAKFLPGARDEHVELARKEREKLKGGTGSEQRLEYYRKRRRALDEVLRHAYLLPRLFRTLVRANQGLTHLITRFEAFRAEARSDPEEGDALARVARSFFYALDAVEFGRLFSNGRDAYLRVGGPLTAEQLDEAAPAPEFEPEGPAGEVLGEELGGGDDGLFGLEDDLGGDDYDET